MEPLSLASLPYRVQRQADRAFAEINKLVEQQVRAYFEGNLDELDALDAKGDVRVGLTLDLTIRHNVRDGSTRFESSVKVKPPKRSAVAGSTMVYRPGQGLMSTAEDPDAAQLDLLRPAASDDASTPARPALVR